jgi:RNA polymerase sigma-70 factor, ECF subfamily
MTGDDAPRGPVRVIRSALIAFSRVGRCSYVERAVEQPTTTEDAVLDRARRGDKDALAALFRTLQPQLLRYLRGRLPGAAEDLAAHTWLDAVRNLHRFTGGPEDFRRWLFTIARRRAQDELRRRARRPEVVTDRPPDVATHDELHAGDDLAQALALVRQLPDAQADAVLLRIVAGMDVSEVAVVMGRSEGSVRVLVHRGLHRLRDVIGRAAWMLV